MSEYISVINNRLILVQSCAVTCHTTAVCITPLIITLQGCCSLVLTVSEAGMGFNALK